MRKTCVRRSAGQWNQIHEELAASGLDGWTFCGNRVEPDSMFGIESHTWIS